MERKTRHMSTAAAPPVPGMLTVAELAELARTKTIDTVVVGLTDCYGRLVGKRYTSHYSLSHTIRSF